MIVIGNRFRPHATQRTLEREPIRTGFNRRPELVQLGRHRGDAVGLFHAPRADATQARAPVREQRHGRGRHGGVGNRAAVVVDAAQRLRPGCLDPVGAPENPRSHRLQQIGERDRRPARLARPALPRGWPTRQRAKCEEIGALEARVDTILRQPPSWHDESSPSRSRCLAPHFQFQTRHQGERHSDIGLREINVARDVDYQGAAGGRYATAPPSAGR